MRKLNLNASGGVCAGQPAYPPEALLKLYLYGYINKVRSSRRLENETYRNLEVIWLVEKLRPSYKTIADFRKNNSKALTATNRDFVLLCKELQLFGGETLGIDGSFFKADASKDSIYTEDKLNQQLQQLEQKINVYQEQLAVQDEADSQVGATLFRRSISNLPYGSRQWRSSASSNGRKGSEAAPICTQRVRNTESSGC